MCSLTNVLLGPSFSLPHAPPSTELKPTAVSHPATMLLVMLASVIYAFQIVGFSKSLTHLGRMHDFFEELLEIPDVRRFLQMNLCKTYVNDGTSLIFKLYRGITLSIAYPHSELNTHPLRLCCKIRRKTVQSIHWYRSTLLSILSLHPMLTRCNVWQKLDAHDVANRVMREENYMVALFNRDVLDLSVPWPRALLNTFPALRNVGNGDLTRVLEWNIRKGLLQYLFGPGAKVRKAFLESSNRDALIQGLDRVSHAGRHRVLTEVGLFSQVATTPRAFGLA